MYPEFELSINYNYLGTGADFRKDIPMLAKVFKHIRLLIISYTDDSPTGIPLWKTVLEFTMKYPFKTITIGLSANPTYLTNTNKNDFTDKFTHADTGFARYMAGIDDGRLILCGANEEMFHHDGSISDTQVRAFIRTHMAAIDAVFPGKKTVSMANGEMFPYFNDLNGSSLPYPWTVDNGVHNGFPSINLYSYHHGATNSATYFYINLNSACAWFGASNLVVSEYGPDPDGYSDTYWGNRYFYAKQFRQMTIDIAEHDIKIATIYNFQDSAFGCMSPGRIYRPHWYSARGEPMPYNVGMR